MSTSGNFDPLNVLHNIYKVNESSSLSSLVTENEIRLLVNSGQEIIMNEPMLLELNSPLEICGDISGYFNSLLDLMELGDYPPNSTYLFLGNYIGEGPQPIEVLIFMLTYKILYPQNIYILRGNQEQEKISIINGFQKECIENYSSDLWMSFVGLFNRLPVAAVVNSTIFCCHGGLSPDLASLDLIKYMERPIDVPVCGLLCDLLWANPNTNFEGWIDDISGISLDFGSQVLDEFLKQYCFHLMCKGGQISVKGFEMLFDDKLIVLSSFSNNVRCGALLDVQRSCECSILLLP